MFKVHVLMNEEFQLINEIKYKKHSSLKTLAYVVKNKTEVGLCNVEERLSISYFMVLSENSI